MAGNLPPKRMRTEVAKVTQGWHPRQFQYKVLNNQVRSRLG